MKPSHRQHPDAGAELRAAAERYEEAVPGRGHDLFEAVKAALTSIDASPEAWPPLPGWDDEPDVRSRRVKGFPYRVVFVVEAEQVLILAYAHERRRPGYWAQRIDDMM